MSILASCSTSIKFHNWPVGIYLGDVVVRDENLCVRSLSWSCRGNQIVSVPSNGHPVVIKLLDNITSTPPNPSNFQCEYLDINKINAADFSKLDNNSLAVGTLEGELYVYDMCTKIVIGAYPSTPNEVKFLRYSNRDTLLAAGSSQGQIILYNSKNVVCQGCIVPNSYSLSAMNFHDNNANLLAAGSKEGILAVWNTESGHAILNGKHHNNIVADVAFHPSYYHVFASVGSDRKFICYDLRTPEYAVVQHLENELAAVAFMANRDEMAVATANGHLLCYDRRKLQMPLSTIIAHNTTIKRIAFQPLHDKNIEYERKWVCDACGVSTEAELEHSDSISSFVAECSPYGDCTSPIENKIPQGMDMLPLCNSHLAAQNVKDAAEDLKNEILMEMQEMCQRFEDYMNECFFEMKIELSKKFIGIEMDLERKKELFLNLIRNKNEKRKTKKTSSNQSRCCCHLSPDLCRKKSSKRDVQRK